MQSVLQTKGGGVGCHPGKFAHQLNMEPSFGSIMFIPHFLCVSVLSGIDLPELVRLRTVGRPHGRLFSFSRRLIALFGTKSRCTPCVHAPMRRHLVPPPPPPCSHPLCSPSRSIFTRANDAHPSPHLLQCTPCSNPAPTRCSRGASPLPSTFMSHHDR